MARELNILGQDIIDDTQNVGKDSVNISDIVGQIARRRTFVISDNQGEYTPLGSGSVFAANDWRNEAIDFVDTSSQTQFSGAVKRIKHKISDAEGVRLELDSIENVGTLLDFSIEENDSTTHTGFLVDGAVSIGDQTVTVDTGTTDIPVNSLVSFSGSLIPRYQVVTASGSPTTSITLDRPAEVDVADNDAVRVSVPATRTIPAAIKRTLETVGLGSKLGFSFDNLDNEDTAASRFVYLNIIVEEKVTLANHIGKLLELGFMFLTVNANGQIDLVRGLAYDGSQITTADLDSKGVTDNELISPIDIVFDDSKLLFAYNLLHISGSSVNFVTDQAQSDYVTKYANTQTWSPIPQNGNLPREYQYLYSDSTHAQYVGELMLGYYQAPRVRITCAMKGFRSNNIPQKISLQLVGECYISMRLNSKNSFTTQPARVISFNKDLDKQLYQSVTFELNNYLSPAFPLNVSNPSPVVVQTADPIDGGFAAVIDDIDDSLSVRVVIYDSLQQFVKIETFTKNNGLSRDPNGLYLQVKGLTNGTQYFYEMATVSGAELSQTTGLVSFTPALQPGKVSTAQVGRYNVGVSS